VVDATAPLGRRVSVGDCDRGRRPGIFAGHLDASIVAFESQSTPHQDRQLGPVNTTWDGNDGSQFSPADMSSSRAILGELNYRVRAKLGPGNSHAALFPLGRKRRRSPNPGR